MNLLICNVGSSDLDRKLLPEFDQTPERARATHILDDYTTYRSRLALPIIGKALRYVQRQSRAPLQVVLVASDQDADAHFWATDTCLTAQVIARRLADEQHEWQPVPPDQIAIWHIGAEDQEGRDPSDYDGVRRFFERRLADLRATYPAATAYLEVTGGTPAMTTGLLVAGTEAFGAQAEVLYIHPRHPLPATLNTGKRLQSTPLRAALRSNIATYAYDAALRTFAEQRAAASDRLEEGAPDVIAALLEHARCLWNFDLPGARHALEGGIDRAGDGRWRAALMGIYGVVEVPTRTHTIKLVYHGAAARYDVGAYADFLTQVVRLQETTLRKLCLDRGAHFVSRKTKTRDPDGSWLDQAWATAEGYQIDSNRGTGRAILLRLFKQQAVKRGEDIHLLLTALNQLEELARLRNELTHSFEGVDTRKLAEAFAFAGALNTHADMIVPHLAQIFTLATGSAPGASPFAAINELLYSLLREARG